MSQLDPAKMIAEWSAEHLIDVPIYWDGYVSLPGSIIGQTTYSDYRPHITLDMCLKARSLWGMVTLWHEFCHAASYIDSGYESAQHGDLWKRWLWRKPLLAFLDLIHPDKSLL